MATFVYEAFTRTGEEHNGTLASSTEVEARAQLKADGLLVMTMRESKSKSLGTRQIRIRKPKVKLKDVAWAARNLATTQTAGLPIVRALRLLGNQRRDDAIGQTLLAVHEDVVNGRQLGEAFRAHEEQLGVLTTALIEAGETNGKLDQSLTKLAELAEARVRIKRKIVSAMAYPAVMAILVMFIFLAMLIFVVPTFEGIFKDLGGELPTPTKVLMSISRFIRGNVLFIIGGIIASVFGFKKLKRKPAFIRAKDKLMLRLPVFGDLFSSTAIARMATTLASSLGSGVPLLDALRLSGNVAANYEFTHALELAREEVREGKSLAQALAGKTRMPELFVNLVAIGEETGRVDDLLQSYARSIEEEVEAKVEGLTSVIEPLMIVVFGGVVGSMVISLYLPLVGIFKFIK